MIDLFMLYICVSNIRHKGTHFQENYKYLFVYCNISKTDSKFALAK